MAVKLSWVAVLVVAASFVPYVRTKSSCHCKDESLCKPVSAPPRKVTQEIDKAIELVSPVAHIARHSRKA